jgi:phosphoglycerate dehydrogenase-like enzyme
MFLKDTEQRIIEALKESSPQSLVSLSKTLGANKSSLYYQIDRLVKRGLLRKVARSPKKIEFGLADQEQMKKFIEEQSEDLSALLTPPTAPAGQEGQKQTLVFTDDYCPTENFIRQLQTKYNVISYPSSNLFLSEETYLKRIKNADIAISFSSIDLKRSLLKKCSHLKAIIQPMVAPYHVDTKACEDIGIKFFHLSMEHSYKRAARREFVIAALFALLRPIHLATNDLKMGGFDYRYFEATEIKGKKIGVVGTKHEGALVIPTLRTFEPRIYVANPDNPTAEPESLGIAEFSSISDLFKTCDIIIFPEEFANPIDLDEYLSGDKIPPYMAFLSATITYSTDILRQQLLNKKIKGLFIDYFPDRFKAFKNFNLGEYRKIMNFPNVVITPEIGFFTKESMERNYRQLTELLMSL